jgi:myo-inositol-1(or 4)-monophosphatase
VRSDALGGAVRRELLTVAMTAAEIGGEVVRGHFARLSPGDVREKGENDPVSVADHASEEAITVYLRRETPEFGVLGEEHGASGAEGARWVVDPLDGTANFVRGFPHFAVSVALMARGRVEVGAVYDPMRRQLYYARRGCGAYCNGSRLSISQRSGLAGGFVSTGFPFRVHHHLDLYLALFREVFLRTGSIRRPGAAALDLVHTAAGIFDAFFEFCLSPWDIAAGALLIEEAGGRVTNFDGDADVFTRGNIVAGSPGPHRELLAVAAGLVRDQEIVVR